MELKILNSESAKILRNKIIDENPICPLCSKNIENPVLDHKHAKKSENIGENGAGLVRGVICRECNIFLGKMENNYKRYKIENLSEFLLNASKYLTKEALEYVYPSEASKLKTILTKSAYNKIIKDYSKKINKNPKDLIKKIKYNKFLNKKLKEILIDLYNINFNDFKVIKVENLILI